MQGHLYAGVEGDYYETPGGGGIFETFTLTVPSLSPGAFVILLIILSVMITRFFSKETDRTG